MDTAQGNIDRIGRPSRFVILARFSAVLALVLTALAADVAAGSPGASAAGGPTVMIVNMGGTCTSAFCYQPNKISINSGTTVTWINTTSFSHTVTRCTLAACGVGGGTGRDAGFGSSVIPPGGSYTFTFDGKGTYIYYCMIHGYKVMHARVIEVT
jgi:plastocyanin